MYRWLPLGTIVNNRVLVVHGGVSDSTDLDLIRSLDRGKVNVTITIIIFVLFFRFIKGKEKYSCCWKSFCHKDYLNFAAHCRIANGFWPFIISVMRLRTLIGIRVFFFFSESLLSSHCAILLMC